MRTLMFCSKAQIALKKGRRKKKKKYTNKKPQTEKRKRLGVEQIYRRTTEYVNQTSYFAANW